MIGYYRITADLVRVCAWCCPEEAEEALSKQFGAHVISHTICDECLGTLYPEPSAQQRVQDFIAWTWRIPDTAGWLLIFAAGALGVLVSLSYSGV